MARACRSGCACLVSLSEVSLGRRMLARWKSLFSLLQARRSGSSSASNMLCKKLVMLLLHNLMLLVAEMLVGAAAMRRALPPGTLALLAQKPPSASKINWRLRINMHNHLKQMCNKWLASARASAMVVLAAEAALEQRGEDASALRRRWLPMGQAFDTSGPESAAGRSAAERGPKEVLGRKVLTL